MAAMGHFIFELIKIAILASIYAAIILLAFRIVGEVNPDSWANKISANKKNFWIWSGRIISAALFVFMFSYWGDHGLGDDSYVPIGYFKTVNQSDDMAYIESKGKQFNIGDFALSGNKLYAKAERSTDNQDNEYIIWNFKNNNWIFYKTEIDYLLAAKANNYPLPNEFKKFYYYYKDYWGGCRFWLLP